MPVSAQDAAAIGIIEKDEFPDHLVLVGSHLLAEKAEGRIPVSFGDVPQHLVVSPVFLDDVNHMFENAGFTDTLEPAGMVDSGVVFQSPWIFFRCDSLRKRLL